MRKVNAAFMRKRQCSEDLASFLGVEEISSPELMTKVWAYIKKNNLQNPKNKREILPDEKLAQVLGSKPINMFSMTKKLSGHLVN